MKRKKLVSALCSMGECESCDPRWIEDDEHGLPTIQVSCTHECHHGGRMDGAGKILDELKKLE